MNVKHHFSRFLQSEPGRLHFAAHSHHPWPDVSFEAHQRAWLDAAQHHDDKWNVVFGEVLPEAQRHIAKELGLTNPSSIAVAPNTHELVLRLLSCLPARPRVVTTDAEFHSFERQLRRLEEDQLAEVTRVPTEPFDSFGARLVEAANRAKPDLVFFSQVFFNSGAVVADLAGLVGALPASAMVVIDGYHGFCAVPTSLAALERRSFYLAGGYKYAMAGEGACFLLVPEGPHRPRNTGWFASFGALQVKQAGAVPYAPAGGAFLGATFDPSGLYRLNAVMRWREQIGLSTAVVRHEAHTLQARFLAGLERTTLAAVPLVTGDAASRAQFVTFRAPDARERSATLKQRQVVTDARDDRWRFGFGPYQDEADVDALLERLR